MTHSPAPRRPSTPALRRLLATAAGLALIAAPTAAAPAAAPLAAKTQQSPIYWLSDFSEVPGGTASLTRRDGSVTYRFDSAGLEPGHVVTLWFCGWNDPALCVDGPGTCGAATADLAFHLPGSYCLWGGGRRVAADGTVSFRTTFRINEPNGEVLFGAFTHPRDAEVNLVVKTHGPVVAGREAAQRSSYDGGCTQNECEEIQIAIFPAE